MIYAVEILDRMFVKIGFCKAEDAQSRIATLQTGSPFEIKLIGLTDGTLMQEKAIHASLTVAFSRIRVPMPPNEWYPGRIPLMRELVDVMPLGANQMLALSEKYSPAVNQGSARRTTDFRPNLMWPKINEEKRKFSR